MNSINSKTEVRVRIAPSPTGFLHIGTARTALFNWLFAKHHRQKGIDAKFFLRIEDTDLERSEERFEKSITDGLKWLGINWDGEVVKQTKRLDIYEDYLKKLLISKAAFYCSHSTEDLEKERAEREAVKAVLLHRCADRDASLKEGVIRFKNDETKVVVFDDIIRGQIGILPMPLGDFVLAKNLRAPLYNFAVVVDDEDMKISHVIRGEDHIPNTPKQVLIQRALGFSQPEYAHLPLILNEDRSKMSKRFSATAIQEYKDLGYLPDALVNFLALLGWHPKDEKEIFTDRKELAKVFDLRSVQHGGAAFDVDKLDWLNAEYIHDMAVKNPSELIKYLGAFEPRILNKKEYPRPEKIVEYTHERIQRLSEFKVHAGFFWELPDYDTQLLMWKKADKKNWHIPTKKNLKEAERLVSEIKEPIDKAKLDPLAAFAKEHGMGDVLWPLRVSLSGQEASPSPFDILVALGKKESLRRIQIAIDKLATNED